jgi:mycothiol synthase
MNLSAITVSFPLDNETYEELKELCKVAATYDGKSYHNIMNLPIAKDEASRGFYVLVYDDDKNKLVGAGTAVDLMGFNTYEWSILVDPMYRQVGIGTAILNVLRDGMDMRSSEGELALMMEGTHFGQEFLQRHGYLYSFSEATLEAQAEVFKGNTDVSLRKFMQKDTEALVSIFCEAFGDTHGESLDLIAFNTSTEGLILWTAELNGKVVGTVTTRKEGEVQWITAFAVAPNMQGKGIGTQILNWVKDYAVRSGEKTILLDVEIDNSCALHVYEKAGFMKSSQLDYFVRIK